MRIFSSLFLEIITIVTNDPTISIVTAPITLLIVYKTGILLTIIFLMITLLLLFTMVFVLRFKGYYMLRVLRAIDARLSIRFRLVKWGSVLIF